VNYQTIVSWGEGVEEEHGVNAVFGIQTEIAR